MSDTDSALSSTIPSDTQLEEGLRMTVKRLQRDDPDGEHTVNRIRRAAEADLSLEAGFFGEGKWKQRSKETIQDQFSREDEEEEVAVKGKNGRGGPKGKVQAKAKAKAVLEKKTSRKRKSSVELNSEEEEQEAVRKPAKKAKVTKAAPAKKTAKKRRSSVDFEDELSDEEEQKPAKKAKVTTTQQEESSALSDADSEPSAPKAQKPDEKAEDASESDMSVLIDDSPAPKQRKKSASRESKAAAKEKNNKAKSSKEAAVPDPDQEETKRLQGQLVQCGIRKVWGKYLKPYETPKAKIKHLREMLVDAGMTGRFSQEKAKQIRDQRELAADLEAVQEGNKAWGSRRSKGDDEDSDERPKRTIAKGLAELDFISDGEES